MTKLEKIKNWVKGLDYRDIHQLLLHLRRRNDIIIPACFTKNDLRQLLQNEGIADHLSDEEFATLKNEFDSCHECYMREWMRTMVLMTLDRSRDRVRHSLSA